MLYVSIPPPTKNKVGISGNSKIIKIYKIWNFSKNLQLLCQKLFDYKDMLYTPITNDISRVRALEAIEVSRLLILEISKANLSSSI